MSVPPYPRYARGFTPGSNAIGTFQIGVSPIGELSPFDPWLTVLSQYANSPVITEMILAFNASMDQTENIESFYDLVVNIATAQGYGLDVWGRIVGVSRTLQFTGAVNYLGNEEAGAGAWTGFNQGILYSGGATTTNVSLSDSDFRTLIYAKAAGNISDGSIMSINKILLTLFPLRGACYVADNQNMSLTYTFQFPLSQVELAIIQQSGVLPNPCGIVINIVQH